MDTIKGVGLIVLAKDTGKILTVKELEDKPSVKKVAGMRSFPEETVKYHEEIVEAMHRLMIEEIGIVIHEKIVYFIEDEVVVPLLPNIRMSVGFTEVPTEFEANPADRDIVFGGWFDINDLIEGDILVRVETRPILERYKKYK